MSADVGQQIQAVSTVASRISFLCKQMGCSPKETIYIKEGMEQAVRSLEFLRNNRDLIRDAVRIAKELDAAAPRE